MRQSKLFIIIFFCTNNIYSFYYSHLPIVVPTPKIHTSCFLIASIEGNIIMDEKNSTHKIYINDNYKKHSLHDIAITDVEFTTKSSMSDITYATTYENKNHCLFRIIFSGEKSEKELFEDIEITKLWLDQFFKSNIYKKEEVIINIPVIYGTTNQLKISSNQNINLIMSQKQKSRIRKKIIYKSVVRAPIDTSTIVGKIILDTPLFKNSISLDLFAGKHVKKGSRFKVFLDSINYLIFGSNR